MLHQEHPQCATSVNTPNSGSDLNKLHFYLVSSESLQGSNTQYHESVPEEKLSLQHHFT